MRHGIIIVISSALLLGSVVPADAAPPSWVNEMPTKKGNTLRVTCHGTGPDSDTAQQTALNSCRSQAAEFITGNFEVQSLSVESEKSVAYHSSVSSKQTVQGLVCNPVKQFKEDGDNSISIQCDFNLATAKVVPATVPPSAKESVASGSMVENASELDIGSGHSVLPASKTVQSRNKQLLLSSVPICTDILIEGKLPRKVDCGGNPMTVLVYPEDRSLIVRADGYLPKTIKLSPSRTPASGGEAVTVFLERN